MDRYKIIRNELTVEEYQLMRQTTDWFQVEDDVVKKSLENDLLSLSVYDGNRIVGMGRIVGDGAIYFYIQDIIVCPDYQGRGVGKLIMEAIENFLADTAYNNSFVGLMAAEGVAGFYHKFGYKERPGSKPGMSKMISY